MEIERYDKYRLFIYLLAVFGVVSGVMNALTLTPEVANDKTALASSFISFIIAGIFLFWILIETKRLIWYVYKIYKARTQGSNAKQD
ncbi:MAG: hypothetical protein PHW62_00835 [Candidatus Ratteibacteria bacterium]|nr:hypothetical protein [Candidatus Ratteibacteria bacterium]